jgi:(1->4)-alpha-D-glucan 1-alpha-D-glucosylmutase
MSKSSSELTEILEQLGQRRRSPLSTYRLQFHQGFNFNQAKAIVPYLSRLGIGDCYSSPFLKARPGSLHGYDICDHNALNPELGTEAEFDALIAELKTHQMGHVLDFVPNHMGVDPDTNPWWHDVLENGQGSRFARYFDIHWNPLKPELKGKVLLPVLGGPYGVILEQGELRLGYSDGKFSIHYYDHRFPVDPKQYARILRWDIERAQKECPDETALREFMSVISQFANLPGNKESAPERIEERSRESQVARERLKRLIADAPWFNGFIQQTLQYFNGQVGQPETFDALHDLLESQAYRLAYWKTAFHEINYRRFFDINGLAGLRVESDEVFPVTHALVMRYLAEGKISGLRIDHPDGLYDPAHYFEALQDGFLQAWIQRALNERGITEWGPEVIQEIRDWRTAERKKNAKGNGARPLYVVAEKILSQGEVLDAHWPIDGTSGYDFLNDVNGLFAERANAERMRDFYIRFTGKRIPFDLIGYVCKKLIMSTSLASELNVLANALHERAESDRRSRDFTLDSLRDALKEVVACFPVYRTYINASRGGAADRQIIERAIAEAKSRNPAIDPSIFEFVRGVLTPDNAEKVSLQEFRRQLGFTMKFQQYTGPVQAKGLEDTAFYRYNVLLSLNEVGSDPTRFGTEVAEFHQANKHRQEEWRYSMLTTTTHDTKRGEDARARLNVLSEIPEDWEKQVLNWSERNQRGRIAIGKDWAPDRNDEILVYQALLGAWAGESTPAAMAELSKRLKEYMLKAVKEAKLHTSWVSPNAAYEDGIARFVDWTLQGEGAQSFLTSFVPFARQVSWWGMLNSLSQVVLKLASPGVPDIYQGAELWDLNLVDPDNRRDVDFIHRERILSQLEPRIQLSISHMRNGSPNKVLVGANGLSEHDARQGRSTAPDPVALFQRWEDGAIKMYVTACGLHLRKNYSDLFLEGAYIPLEIKGEQADHVVAFARAHRNQTLITVVPRKPAKLVAPGDLPVGRDVWRSTRLVLPPHFADLTYRNIFTSTEHGPSSRYMLADLLGTFPVGLFLADL